MQRLRTSFTLAIGLLFAACGQESLSGPEAFDAPPALAEQTTVCEVIDFEGLAHGDQIQTLTVFGLTLDVLVAPGGASAQPAAYAYDSDHVGGPDFDLEWNGAGAACPDCEGQGRMMVIGSSLGFAQEGDAEEGGFIAITGFSGHGEFFVESFLAIDSDDYEPPMHLVLDGVGVASSSQLGNGTVEKVTTAGQTFMEHVVLIAGTPDPNDAVNGTGAFDDLVICKLEPPPPPPPGGGEGCTPGYWKQPQHFDSWAAPYTPEMQFSAVFADAFPGKTLVEVASLGGGGLKALGRHAVAALLNAANAEVDYDLTVDQVIAKFDAAFASGSYEATKDEFEGFNEQGCDLN